MRRLTSLEDLDQLREIILDDLNENKRCLVISAGTCGQASGANDIIRKTKRYILEKELQDKITLRITGCNGFCEIEPFIIVEPEKNVYPKLKMDNVPKIIDAALEGKIVEELIYKDPDGKKIYKTEDVIPFYKKQTRTILGRNELVDPIRINNYIRQDGYKALQKVLALKDKSWITEEIIKSGLRGRGGAGFLTGKKWEIARASGNGTAQKFMVCNADEGDPGAYMDRSLLEGNPHSIIEGLLIAGIAINATKGIIYVRSEYPLAIKHTLIALRQAREIGLLGEDILGTGISFDIEIVRGAGAFVCGEETALIRSIEGKMGEPRQRPPYPTDKGIFGYPTCINNVETLANVPVIISEGAVVYSKVGVPGNSGTKIFSLVGKIRNTGLVEVPMGLTIKEMIYDIGCGSIGKAEIKAVQTGGPSGGCIPASMFDVMIDYESLEKTGSIMGSGGMIVMDDRTCMVDIAKYYMHFLMEESCGKCFTCRKGTQRMHEILTDISNGEGTLEQVELLEELAHVVKDTTMCGLGQTASNPVLSTIQYFRDEYNEHINNHKCPAGVCKELIRYRIDKEKCTGCLLCKLKCPEEAISGEKKQPHLIDEEKCIKCGICYDVCKFEAVILE
ncbi:NADH-ubiquinone oxidoreductase-F iron-sulfur binding region domain-containing protein [candidate division KSB1 bacterium]